MPYIILIFGILATLYALYRFCLWANVEQIKFLFSVLGITLFALVLIFFALTGRFYISLGFIALSIPFVIGHYRRKQKEEKRLKQIEKQDDSEE